MAIEIVSVMIPVYNEKSIGVLYRKCSEVVMLNVRC